MKAGGLTLDRIWAYDSDSDATIAEGCCGARLGMQCFFMLGDTDNLAWMCSSFHAGVVLQHLRVLQPTDNANNDTNIAQETGWWITDVPKLRALNRTPCSGDPPCIGREI